MTQVAYAVPIPRTLHMLHQLDAEVGDLASTVRNGRKWSDLDNGEVIQLCTCRSDDEFGPDQEEDHVVRGTGVVVQTWVGFFGDVPARLIEQEHEERSRMFSGLLDSMKKAYGKDFDEYSIVTVLVYRRVS